MHGEEVNEREIKHVRWGIAPYDRAPSSAERAKLKGKKLQGKEHFAPTADNAIGIANATKGGCLDARGKGAVQKEGDRVRTGCDSVEVAFPRRGPV